MSKVEKEFKKWGQVVSIHAIPFITGGQKLFLKIVWIFSLVISVGLCMYLLYTIISDYFNYEVNTVVQMERDEEREFPTISFCSSQICGVNNFTNDKYLDLYFKETFNLTGGLENGAIKNKLNEMDWSKDEVFQNILNSFYKNYGNYSVQNVSLKENLIKCKYNDFDCDESFFEFFKINEYQKCYKFNSAKFFNGTSKEIYKTQRFGKKFGLQLELFLGKRDSCASPFSKTSGILVYIHNKSYPITEELMQNGIEIAMGTETNIGIDRLYVDKLPLPYNQNNPCVKLDEKESFANDMIKKTFKANGIYSQIACKQMCLQEFFGRTQQCSAEFLPFANSKSYPNFCKREIYQNQSLSNNDQEYSKCLEMCQIDCEEFRFQYTVSNSEFPSINYVNALQQKPLFQSIFSKADFEDPYRKVIKSSIIAFNIYYQTDLYRAIVDSPKMGQTAIVSQVGNYTGLFLGASLLSVAEVCGLGLNLLLAIKSQSKKKNQVDEASSSSDSGSESDDD